MSEDYTYSGPAGQSDIDVTLGNDEWMEFQCQWDIKEDWCVSDHNAILMSISLSGDINEYVAECGVKWRRKKDTDWDEYARLIKMEANKVAVNEYDDLCLDDKIRNLIEWIGNVNDMCFGKAPRIGRVGNRV